MSKVVLHYFNLRALGQGPRTLLAYGGQEFEDRRWTGEEWPEFKPKTPFGQMPVLEWDGKLFAQCAAICRFLGRKYGLAGDTLEEDLEIDQNIDYVRDLLTVSTTIFREEDQELKAKKHEEAAKNKYPQMLSKLDEIVNKNNGYIACGKLTWGDFFLAGMMDGFKMLLHLPDLYEKYPNLKRVYDNVAAIPKVKAFIDKSPETVY